jgi:hypothetical protein
VIGQQPSGRTVSNRRRRRARRGVGAIGLVGVMAIVAAACGVGITGPAADVTDTSARLTGSVGNTVVGATDYWFEYGPTSGYGSTTPRGTVNVATPTSSPSVQATVSGLAEATTYHFRLCTAGSDHAGTCGADATFTTTTGRDSVSGRGIVLDLGFGYVIGGAIFATSGPDGAAPVSGSASTAPGSYYFKISDTGSVTCLRVVGNRAAIGFVADPIDLGQPDPLAPVPKMVFVEDNGPTGDRFAETTLSEPATTCPVPTADSFPGFLVGTVLVPPIVGSGDFVVHDH